MELIIIDGNKISGLCRMKFFLLPIPTSTHFFIADEANNPVANSHHVEAN